MDPRALVVGNSDGIGLALTRRLLAQGWTVSGLSRSASPVRHDRYTHRVAALGGVDVCVYAAGVGEFVDVADLRPQTRTLAVNLLGAAATLEAVVPGMVAAGHGHVVLLSSLADALPSGAAPADAASKAGLTAYGKGLARALRPHGVAVTVIRFGFVDTKMARSPVRPFMLSVGQALDVVVRSLCTRPVVVSRPRRAAALLLIARAAAHLPIRAGKGAAAPGRPR